MKTYNIRGIPVRFPYDAYDVQLKVMEKMIEALQAGNNALIESPTGTGKTLCLLCAVLGWREALSQKIQLEKMLQYGTLAQRSDADKAIALATKALEELKRAVFVESDQSMTTTGHNEPPKIYYASRTHSQLSQAVSELRRTDYIVKTRVLASREHMCINDHVLQSTKGSNAIGNICRMKVNKKECEYFLNVEGWSLKGDVYDIMDIEDLNLYGKQKKLCPYYLAREDLSKAEVIFLPYNYLIDPQTRKAQKIDLNNSIILFDEAHNLESSCGETFSFDLSPKLFSSALLEIQQCVNIVSNPRYISKSGFGAEDFAILKALVKGIQKHIQDISLNNTNQITKPGEFIMDAFKAVKINHDNQEMVLKIMDTAIDIILNETHQYRKSSSALSLQDFQAAMKVVFKNGHLVGERLRRAWSCYKVHIYQEKNFQTGQIERTLSLWCFSSGVAMKDLIKNEVRSVILASGTLSPLSSFAIEMGIPFKVRLENGHVIKQDQISVNILIQGPSGQRLNSSYETRSSVQYIQEMGNIIANIARTTPDGLLVFFPSYVIMSSFLEEWKKPISQNGKSIFDRIGQYKTCVTEPRNKALFNQSIEEYYKHVAAGSGAAFFAICRGKASEGIDFSDAKGRTVVIFGIPYPAAKEPKVVMKKQYLDDLTKFETNALSGNEWYKQQAARALNQAIGRVIRHRKDFGAIVLCDERFAQATNINQLPIWIRPYINVCRTYGEFQSAISRFFKLKNTHDKIDVSQSSIYSTAVSSGNPSPKVPFSEDTSDPSTMSNSIEQLQRILGQDLIQSRVTVHQKRINAYRAALLEVKENNPNSTNGAYAESLASDINSDLISDRGVNKPISSSSCIRNLKVAPKTKEFMDLVKSSISLNHYKEYYSLLKNYREKKIEGEDFLDSLKSVLISGLKEREGEKKYASKFFEIWTKFRSFVPKRHFEYYRKIKNV